MPAKNNLLTSGTPAVDRQLSLGWGSAKILGGILCLALLSCCPAVGWSAVPVGAYSLGLAWDPSAAPVVAGYCIHYGTASGNYSNTVWPGNNLSTTIHGLNSGVTYFFVVSVYDWNGAESPNSSEISYVPGLPHTEISVTADGSADLALSGLIGHTYEIQATQDLTEWTVIGLATMDAAGLGNFSDTDAASYTERFYRTRDTLL